MHWKGGDIPQYDDRLGDPCIPRKLFDDTAILLACKFIYNEAQPELIAKSTLVVEINDVDELEQFPNILNSVRYLEIKDSNLSEGHQVFLPPRYGESWTSEEAEEENQVTALHLRRIKALLKQTPSLKRVIIGYEVLHVLLNSKIDWRLGNSQESMAQAYLNFKMSGLGELRCTGIGTWRVEQSESPVVEVKHFIVVSQFDKCKMILRM